VVNKCLSFHQIPSKIPSKSPFFTWRQTTQEWRGPKGPSKFRNQRKNVDWRENTINTHLFLDYLHFSND